MTTLTKKGFKTALAAMVAGILPASALWHAERERDRIVLDGAGLCLFRRSVE